MKTLLALLLPFLLATGLMAGPVVNIDQIGQRLGGWSKKGGRAAEYESSGSKYRTWKPEVTAMVDGGIFISLRIDHMRGILASDDHAILQVTLDKNGHIREASSSMALQGRKITSDVIRMGSTAGSSVVALDKVAKIGTDLVADLSSKLFRENIVEPGRVSYPAVINHNYNVLCLATGLIKENQMPATDPIDTPTETAVQETQQQKTLELKQAEPKSEHKEVFKNS